LELLRAIGNCLACQVWPRAVGCRLGLPDGRYITGLAGILLVIEQRPVF